MPVSCLPRQVPKFTHTHIKKIKKHTSAFWWHYMIESGMKEGCYKSFMDCFEMMHRLVAHQSE